MKKMTPKKAAKPAYPKPAGMPPKRMAAAKKKM